jgi:hypothetical protein
MLERGGNLHRYRSTILRWRFLHGGPGRDASTGGGHTSADHDHDGEHHDKHHIDGEQFHSVERDPGELS